MTIQVLQISSPRISNFLTLTIEVPFEGTDQLLLDTFNYESKWNGSSWTYIQKEPTKFMLNSIQYSLSSGEFRIEYVKATGFRKDNRLRARETYFHGQEPHLADFLKQIPDHFHNKARAEFDRETQELINELTTAKQKGLQL